MLPSIVLCAYWDIYIWDAIVNIPAVKAEMRQILDNSKIGFTPPAVFGTLENLSGLMYFSQ